MCEGMERVRYALWPQVTKFCSLSLVSAVKEKYLCNETRELKLLGEAVRGREKKHP